KRKGLAAPNLYKRPQRNKRRAAAIISPYTTGDGKRKTRLGKQMESIKRCAIDDDVLIQYINDPSRNGGEKMVQLEDCEVLRRKQLKELTTGEVIANIVVNNFCEYLNNDELKLYRRWAFTPSYACKVYYRLNSTNIKSFGLSAKMWKPFVKEIHGKSWMKRVPNIDKTCEF
ncbi:hypothetical protein LINPERPRIM_LOCUS35193, partial [Linum perenne]